MNNQLSAVIICRNEAPVIGRAIAAALRFTDDVVVVDSGSTDGTQQIVIQSGARLLETSWEGYGPNKNKGVALAKYDWILSIDADELVDETLAIQLQNLNPVDETVVYIIRFRIFLGEQMIRFGEWSNESHIRLYHRRHTGWSEASVHETLQMHPNTQQRVLKGYIDHYTSKNIAEFSVKMVNYALLNALKYQEQGKKSGWINCYVSPPFSFVKNYFFRLGFLDGEAGFTIAKMNAWYTWLKYARLRELNRGGYK